MLLTLVITFVVALLIGLIIHYLFTRYRPSPCAECSKKSKTKNIWENLEVSKVVDTKRPEKKSTPVTEEFVEDSDEEDEE